MVLLKSSTDAVDDVHMPHRLMKRNRAHRMMVNIDNGSATSGVVHLDLARAEQPRLERFPSCSKISLCISERIRYQVWSLVERSGQMIVGYARTSTTEQVAGFEAQDRDLKTAGAERIYAEQVSSVGARPELEDALGFVRQGDVFVVTKLDRLARSVANLLEIVARLEAKGVALRILNLGLDTATPTGKLMLTVMGGVAEFERSMMLERQREGIAKAKAEGVYKGRKPTARAKVDEVRAMKDAGKSMREIAEALGISVGSVHGLLKTAA